MSFDPYKDAFMDRLLLAGLSPDTSLLTIEFSTTLPANVLGQCSQIDGLYERVTINQTLWTSLTAGSKEELMFHELSHCLLNRGHVLTQAAGIPVSIMYPYHLGSTYVAAANYAGYQTELFSTLPAVFSGYLFDPAVYRSPALSADESVIQHEHLTEERIFFCPDEGHEGI